MIRAMVWVWTKTITRRSCISRVRLFDVDFHTRTLAISTRSPEDVMDHVRRRSKIILQGTIPHHGEGIQVGQFTELRRTFSQEDINNFGALIGDFNPVHFSAAGQLNDKNIHVRNDNVEHIHHIPETRPILHGILLSSLFSSIFGTLIPGCIYRSQTLKFHQPVYVNEMVCGRILVTKLREIGRVGGEGVLCTCDTRVTKADMNSNTTDKLDNSMLCVTGEAQVWLPGVALAQNTSTDN
jgi:acyl dehydratase